MLHKSYNNLVRCRSPGVPCPQAQQLVHGYREGEGLWARADTADRPCDASAIPRMAHHWRLGGKVARKPSSSKTHNQTAFDATLESALREERGRIAKEIHDGVSQSLALLILKMEVISRLADSDPPRVKAELQEAMSILETGVQELRQVIDTLLPPSSPPKP